MKCQRPPRRYMISGSISVASTQLGSPLSVHLNLSQSLQIPDLAPRKACPQAKPHSCPQHPVLQRAHSMGFLNSSLPHF